MRVLRNEPVDRLSHAGESVLLYERQVVRVGLIGTAIFESAGEPIDLETLSGRLEREFGGAPGGETLAATREAVVDLVDRGVLTIEPDSSADPQPPSVRPDPGLTQPDPAATADR